MPELRRKATTDPIEWRRILDRNTAALRRNPNASANRRRSDLKRHYGLTPAQWDSMFDSQEHRCAVCRSPSSGRKNGQWTTDHDHNTGRVRGILCNGCNASLGHMKDDPLRIRLLAEYVERGGAHASV